MTDIWAYLSASPLAHLTLTLVAFQAGVWVYEKGGKSPLLNPVLIGIVLVIAVLLITGTPYHDYFQGAKFVHFLLGPATVALAIPLYRQFDKVRRSAPAILISILAGSLVAAGSAIGAGWALNASPEVLASLAPKSVTTPVAMGISEHLGGLPSLTAVLVILTGIVGATLGPVVLNLFGIRDQAARGLGIGTGAHGIGTARALQESEASGAFSGLAMGLNALATSILLPILWHLVF